MKIYQNSKGYYCRAYNSKTKKTKVIHGVTRNEALILAKQYESGVNDSNQMSFANAYEEFSEGRTTLSPSTLRGYASIYNTHLQRYKNLPLQSFDTALVQRLVDELSPTHSPKTVSNVYGFVISVLRFHNARTELNVRLPMKLPPKKKLPSTDDVKRLVEGSPQEIKLVLELAVYGGLRRGEICALTRSDFRVEDGKLYVNINKSYSLNKNYEWVLKTPKTYKGYREIEIPMFILDELPEGDLFELSPTAISHRYTRYAKKIGFNYNFHILRHWSASYLKHQGVSDAEVMKRFGWSTLDMLKVYVDVIESESRTTSAINNLLQEMK